MKGFAAAVLDNIKDPENVGGVLRAAGIFGASLVVISGNRIEKYINHPTDTMKAYRTVPAVITSDVFEALPYSCVPIAVDILDGAVPLPDFKHPERTFYIFGAGDHTLYKGVRTNRPGLVPGKP